MLNHSKKSDDVVEIIDEKASAWAPDEPAPARRGRLGTAAAVLWFLLPEFFTSPCQKYFMRSKPVEAWPPLNATSYLDGLRGVAALIVYMFHYSYRWETWINNGWGSTEQDHWFLQLPIVRIVFAGRSSVTVFFAISGFVLTIRPLMLLHRGQQDRLLDALGGALFRRPFRLFLPITASTGIIATLCQMGLFPRGGLPTVADTPGDQFRHWLGSLSDLWNPFRSMSSRSNRYSNPYDGNMWSIPVEFKGSLLVFLLLLGLLRVRCWMRLLIVAVATVWLIRLEEVDMSLFTAGLFLAELSVIRPPASLHGAPTSRLGRLLVHFLVRPERRAWFSHVARHAVTLLAFFIGLWVLCFPHFNPGLSPGYRTIFWMTPAQYTDNDEKRQWFWLGIGSMILFVALMYSPPLNMPHVNEVGGAARDEEQGAAAASLLGQPAPAAAAAAPDASSFDPEYEPLLQRLFTNRFARYLGRHSYSLYLAHDSCNNIIANGRVARAAGTAWNLAMEEHKRLVEAGSTAQAEALYATARSEHWRYFIVMTILNTLLLFWVSDVFTRAVDVNCVKLARRFQRWAWGRS